MGAVCYFSFYLLSFQDASFLYHQHLLLIIFCACVLFLIKMVFGCLQWISTHPWVMLICTISLSKNWAYSGNIVHLACISFLDSLRLYFWIPTGMYIFHKLLDGRKKLSVLLIVLFLYAYITYCFCCVIQLETLLKFFPIPSYRNLTLQCLTEVHF